MPAITFPCQSGLGNETTLEKRMRVFGFNSILPIPITSHIGCCIVDAAVLNVDGLECKDTHGLLL